MFQPRLNSLISAATDVFGSMSCHFPDVTLPKPLDGHQNVQIASLWTKDGLRPRWGNLAAVADFAQSADNLEWWHEFLTEFGIPLGMLVIPEHYLFLSRTPNGKIKTQPITAEELPTELARQRDALFTPRALGKLRTGQLSFADMEESVTPESFAFLTRQRKQLDQALQDGILGAITAQNAHRQNLVKIPHHGAWPKNSSELKTLLEKIDPEVAVLSVGSKNPYGHVVPELFRTLLTLQAAPSQRLKTFLCTEVTRTCIFSASERARMGRAGLASRQPCAGDIVITVDEAGQWVFGGKEIHRQRIEQLSRPACLARADL